MKGLITKIQKFSLHDGPGIRTTVFLKGCQLSCVWCHNPENLTTHPEVLFLRAHCIGCRKCTEVCSRSCFLWNERILFNSNTCNQCGLCVQSCPSGTLSWSSREISSNQIIEEAMSDKLYYDISGGGITLSGGEPLGQIDFCLALAKEAKTLGLHVAVDTSGFAPEHELKRITPWVDLFLFDLKFIDSQLHQKYTGQSNNLILDNFRLLCKAKKTIIVRVPVIAGITDSKDNLTSINDFVKRNDPAIEIDYIPFNRLMVEKYNILGKSVYSGIKLD